MLLYEKYIISNDSVNTSWGILKNNKMRVNHLLYIRNRRMYLENALYFSK